MASTDPLITFYHDGFLRVSLLKYNKNSKEKSIHLTNTSVSKNIFNDPSKYQELREKNLKDKDQLQRE